MSHNPALGIHTAADSGTFYLGDDIPVHRLGFGAMRITGPGIWGPPEDRDEAVAVLRRCVDLGINLLDTAESYGPWVSEELIAKALHPYPAGMVIATKGGLDRPGPDKWVLNCRPDRLREGLEGSLRRLKVDRIDLYHLHRIDPAVPEDEQFGFLRSCQAKGLIRHIGLSEATVDQIERARRFFRVTSVQNLFNLADRRWEAVIDYCEREGIAFIPWFPLQAGDVGTGGGAVTRIAERHGAKPSQVALAWLLQRSPVLLPIPGTSRRTHLDENMGAAGLQLSDDEFRALS